jgi:CrcB protein
MMSKLLWIALAGAVGSLSRYGLQGLVQRHAESMFPWGTLAVNVLGCFLFGLAWALAEERGVMAEDTRVILLVGFMGAFTTFSSFAYDTFHLARDAQWMLAAANVAAQNVVGFLALVLGVAAVRVF